jgi:hypothetical protein
MDSTQRTIRQGHEWPKPHSPYSPLRITIALAEATPRKRMRKPRQVTGVITWWPGLPVIGQTFWSKCRPESLPQCERQPERQAS